MVGRGGDAGVTKEDIDYDIENPEFKELMRILALGTTAIFSYSPDEEKIKRKIAKKIKKKPKKVNDDDVAKHGEWATKELVKQEEEKTFQIRTTAGDASESGLIKFCEPVIALKEYREKYPTYSYNSEANGKSEEVTCEIPFNSFNKYNLLIRDMSGSDEPQDQGESKRKNKLVIMKGAPERIWGRCSYMLVNGEEVEKTEKHEEAFNKANSDLGKQGERVLAFARVYLDPAEYPEDFEFNMKKDDYNFPMTDLCFIGVVSLNDPPRMYVDHSVDVCRAAGIKVIMVTGDQPVTAAAIAKKVNIFTEGAIVNVDLIE